MTNKEEKLGKTLTFWLRHHPEDINLNMDSNGWVDIKELIQNSRPKIVFDYNELKKVVSNDNKGRFSLDSDMCKIRANQGHNKNLTERIGLIIDSQIEVTPPAILYHGTKYEKLDYIQRDGICKMSRSHVHLSVDIETAQIVANRGEVVVLSY